MADVTGALTSKAEAAPVDPRRAVDVYGERYRANPKDADAAWPMARRSAPPASARKPAVLEQATIANPGNKTLLAGYGRALADNGNSQAAFDVLGRAHWPKSGLAYSVGAGHRAREARQARGSAQLLQHRLEDRARRAVGAVQSRPLLHAGAGPPNAEQTLRRAYGNPRADVRIRQNLALVVGLQEGRFAEAENIAKGDLPAEEATANVAYLREMLSRKDSPRGGSRTVPVASLNRPD